jgi:hypothetical protein
LDRRARIEGRRIWAGERAKKTFPKLGVKEFGFNRKKCPCPAVRLLDARQSTSTLKI